MNISLCYQVLKVVAKTRIGPSNFITAIRETLKNHYGDKVLGTYILSDTLFDLEYSETSAEALIPCSSAGIYAGFSNIVGFF